VKVLVTGAEAESRRELVIIGASARAACFSAARAGFAPWWIDQFGDTDLRARFPGAAVAAADWPAGIIAALEQAPMAPVLYTGALENHPRILERIAARRPLFGNAAEACARVRDPALLRERLQRTGIRCPAHLTSRTSAPAGRRWLRKPLRSGGGTGIEPVDAGAAAGAGWYLQEFVHGESCAAVFIGADTGAQLLGVTSQWVGDADFHAPPFSYCGSLGPIGSAPGIVEQWQRAGDLLAGEFGLRGLFGVDAVVDGGRLVVIEINPRYTASVEVLEAALGIHAIELHVAACTGRTGRAADAMVRARTGSGRIHGKAILFAPADLVFGDTAAQWLARDHGVTFADLPAPGTRVARGSPVLTVLGRADDQEKCAALLRAHARDVYDRLGKS
jgi:predicted ATP-grasp superfamily ATP-dependent carboligase